MRVWYNSIVVTIAACTLISIASSIGSSEAASSSDNITHLDSLIEACPSGDSTCGKVEGKSLVQLRKGHKPSSHLSYISDHLHVDPAEEWQLKWHANGFYSAMNVSTESLNLLRQDPGVEEIEEGYWFQMSLVDRCRHPKYSEEERVQCYVAKSLPPCEDPRLSQEQRLCYDATLLNPCDNPMFTEVERRSCQETSLLDSHERPEHSRVQLRSIQDAHLVDSSGNLLLPEQARQTCAREPETKKPAIYGRSAEL